MTTDTDYILLTCQTCGEEWEVKASGHVATHGMPDCEHCEDPTECDERDVHGAEARTSDHGDY